MNDSQRDIDPPLADNVQFYEEDPKQEVSRSPLSVVIALGVLAAFAGVVWFGYTLGVERARQGAWFGITAPEGPVRVAPPEAAPPPTEFNVYNIEPIFPEQETKTSALATQTAEPPPIHLDQAEPPSKPAARAAAPALRPAAPAQTAQVARPSKPAAPTGRAVSGAAVLQLGAFESQELANGAWETFRARYRSAANWAPDVQRADLGAKGVMYRLRAGPFASRAAATRACVQLKAAGANCFVTAP